MDLLHNLLLGFGVALTPMNLLYCLLGAILGTLIGVLPGIGPLATIAMLLPITFTVPPVAALIMLAGIYYGAQYGGSTTSILVNIPGESSSVVTCIDGYAMARQGRAGPALSIAALGSFFAGCLATVVIALFAPPLAELALKFGPAEYFSLMGVGLVVSVVLAHGSLLKAIGMVFLGLLLGLVGTDVNSGTIRFSFGLSALADGIGFVVVAMGLFGFADILTNLEFKGKREIFKATLQKLMPSAADLRASFLPVLRGTVIGSMLGILPGGGAILSSFSSYALEKRLAADPSRFGQGAIEGVAGPESANNAGAQTFLHSLIDSGHPLQRRNGPDAGGHDDSRDFPRPASDDGATHAFLGSDRQHVGRQSGARSAQPPAHRDLGPPADDSLPAALSGDPVILLHRCAQPQQ